MQCFSSKIIISQRLGVVEISFLTYKPSVAYISHTSYTTALASLKAFQSVLLSDAILSLKRKEVFKKGAQYLLKVFPNLKPDIYK